MRTMTIQQRCCTVALAPAFALWLLFSTACAGSTTEPRVAADSCAFARPKFVVAY